MKRFQQVRTSIREKSGKKLQTFTVLTALLIACIVFISVLLLNSYSKLKLLDQYIREVPVIVEDREEELYTRSAVFEEDVIARGELGVKVFQEETDLSAEEKLEKIRSVVLAESVSLTDEKGTVLNTTGPVCPAELFETRVRALEMRTPYLELYPASREDSQTAQDYDGTGFVMLPLEEEAGQRLVFEFSCDPLLDIYNTLGNWPSVLKRMLSGLEASAFVRTGEGVLEGYPLDSFTDSEREKLMAEVSGIFLKKTGFISMGSDSSCCLTSFLGRPALALRLPYPKMDADILMLVPLAEFLSTSVYSALTLSAFIILSLILFSLYTLKLSPGKDIGDDPAAFRCDMGRTTRAGRVLILGAIFCFSVMLLALENNATIAYIGTTKRTALENEVEWHDHQQETIRSSYKNLYRTRTSALALLLTDHKEYRTHSDLKAFCDTLHADYLMLFDETGHEITASNSYTGFSVGGPEANLSDEYRAVLLGYPFAVVGPAEDPYTKKQQIGTAILMTKETGEPDGFLLAVFDAAAMNAELENETLEHTVSSFAVTEGNEAAVIDNETGVFLAHTDENKIGLKADYYIATDTYGDDYAGFAEYDGKTMYVSGVSDDIKTLLFMVPDHPESTLSFLSLLMILAVLLITGFLYCPKACELCVAAMNEAIASGDITEEEIKADRNHPLMIFTYGYAIFFTLLAGITLVAAYTLVWPAFTFVFGGLWSRGVHLFSLWAALFFLSVTLTVAILIRTGLQEAEKRAVLRVRTLLKLADSSVAYAAGALIVIGILYMFGVNTTALLASAGIVSIAVGMGAKDMAADILAGLFIAIEDSIHMGDAVKIDDWKGRVTNMGIRTIELTDDRQNVKILNNSKISNVVNMSRLKSSCVMELPLKRHAGMAETEAFLKKTVEKAMEEMPELYGSLKLEGIHDITRDDYTVRLSYDCAEAARKSVTKRLKDFMEQQVLKDKERKEASDT